LIHQTEVDDITAVTDAVVFTAISKAAAF